jgi:catechol 2,3-dioxygenase-like lactoylglutathione lyase family enzyme
MDWKLEVVVIPVSDVDRAKQFYSEQLGFNVDVDNRMGESFRNVQLTPPGSACSVTIGTGLTPGLQLVVGDIRPLEPNWLSGVLRSARSSTLRGGSGSTGPADRGTRSSLSRIPTATTGPCRSSPWPHERSAASANHSRVVVQSRT